MHHDKHFLRDLSTWGNYDFQNECHPSNYVAPFYDFVAPFCFREWFREHLLMLLKITKHLERRDVEAYWADQSRSCEFRSGIVYNLFLIKTVARTVAQYLSLRAAWTHNLIVLSNLADLALIIANRTIPLILVWHQGVMFVTSTFRLS